MQKTHDIGFLLAGENKEKRPRSKHTIDIFRHGRIGYIFISGGPGAEAKANRARKKLNRTLPAFHYCIVESVMTA